MSKQQREAALEQLQLVARITTRIVAKLAALGYSRREIDQNLLSTISSVTKIKSSQFKNLPKWLT